MKNLAYLLLVGSFLGTAFIASLDPLQVTWVWFAPVIAVGFVGVVVLRRIEHAAASAEHVLAAHREDIENSLNNIIEKLDTLNSRKENIPPYDMRFEIDRLLRDDLRNFADARHSLKHIYSLQAYADIMSHFAAGERYVNRVWSASADGYVDEVRTYLGRAYDMFIDARKMLEDVHARHA